MDSMIDMCFAEYLSRAKNTDDPEYNKLAKVAVLTEECLRSTLSEEQTKLFEELSDIRLQIHYLEVKECFRQACRLGAKLSKELFT